MTGDDRRRWEALRDLGADLEAAGSDRRPDGALDAVGLRIQSQHGSHPGLEDAGQHAPPAGVNPGDDPGVAIDQEDGHTVGGGDDQWQVRRVAVTSPSASPTGPGAVHRDHAAPMDLMHTGGAMRVESLQGAREDPSVVLDSGRIVRR